MIEEMQIVLTEIQKLNSRFDTMQDDMNEKFKSVDKRFNDMDANSVL
ncbi:hypothetical protein [Lentibacillus amyloliquefaciens]|nr:hypothetical protein [Lentibacillus amyloliquefaciens]